MGNAQIGMSDIVMKPPLEEAALAFPSPPTLPAARLNVSIKTFCHYLHTSC